MQSSERNYHSFSSSHVLIGIIVFIISCSIIILAESKNIDGFSTELIHINSPLSPFFNQNLTTLDLLNHTKKNGSFSLIYDTGHYLMKLLYGDPEVKYYHIIDTGSELSWIQCLPCTHCYSSDYPPFNPKNSKTFKSEPIHYNITYGDKSHSRGLLARETLTVGSGLHKRKFKNFLFGCGHDNAGLFPKKSGGLVGLNHQEKSFIFQLREFHHGKFSYCMAPPGSSHAGKISFGNKAIVSGNNIMTTPLILDSFYNILLDAITVGTKKLKYFPDSYLKSNNSDQINVQLKLMIDSGLSVLYLSDSFYSQVETTIKKYIKEESPIGAQGRYKLCYSSLLRDASIPKIKLHFPGVVLDLSPLNTFVQDDRHRCLAILPRNASFALGYMAQSNFLVGFDLVEKKISFKPTNCSML